MEMKKTLNNFLEEIHEQYLNVDLFDNNKDYIQNSLSSIVKKINGIIHSFPDEPLLYHMKGVCLYRYPKSDASTLKETEKSFLKVIDLDSRYYWATFYIGCLYFDQKKYHDSLRYLNMIEKGFFEIRNQIWRELKIQELIVCCIYYINPFKLNFNVFYELKKSYLLVEEENQPVPFEITKCIAKLIARYKIKSKEFYELAKSCLELIEVLDFKDLLVNHVEVITNYLENSG